MSRLPQDQAESLRRRFERSVLGANALMPDDDQKEAFGLLHEYVASYPCGPDTSFQDKTPMPHKFTSEALPAHNSRHENQRPVNPCYITSSSDIGRLSMSVADLPMRYYPSDNRFTANYFLGGANPKNNVNTGLNTAMDRSYVHHTYDQGWSGSLKLGDHNISSLSYARAAARAGR